MRILITGITSIHGWPIYKQLEKIFPTDSFLAIGPPKMTAPTAANIVSLCITNTNKLIKLKQSFNPTHVIHCAGVCDLDVCEERPKWAHDLNVNGTKTICDIFGENSYILYISTDLVFSGNKPPENGYNESHTPDPISIAGKTFALAEEEIKKCPNHCIVRLGLPLGDSVNGDKGAIDWVESRFKRNLPVTLFHDEYRSCISCEEIEENIIKLLLCQAAGIYHYGGLQPLSLYEIGLKVLAKGNYPSNLLKGINREEEISGPPRIGNVALDSNKITIFLNKIKNQSNLKIKNLKTLQQTNHQHLYSNISK